ncbi:hypothetical protein [Mycolicibacterium goodii]|uniref:Uncharacterized protein n=1 Tax=Mycolicibacterium goodii TaxID=134601 RepID=A0A0K0XF47_MYCGD|nr:hypothetical protein AFA91_02630 [Mycolicibacterium goodii]
MAAVVPACSSGTPQPELPESPERAVHRHIAAAKTGDVATLRSGACGRLASVIGPRTDDEIREEFIALYEVGPDVLSVESAAEGPQRIVTGYYSEVADLDISFVVEDHDGWKVCEIRRGNGVFGPLPGPFEG